MANLHLCLLLMFCLTYIDTSSIRLVCKDGSNEDSTCEEKEKGGCRLPNHPEFGNWSIIGTSKTPKTFAPPQTVLKVDCNKGYILEGPSYLACINGTWSSEIGKCLKSCPPQVSTGVMRVTCIHKNRELVNCTDAIDGTLAKFECSPFHKDVALEKRSVYICKNGTWNQPTPPHCLPVCGQKPSLATSFIESLLITTNYPWQVALYNKSDKVLLCGGTLLSQKVILTAAHCVTDLKGKLNPKEDYIVTVGKYYRQFDDTRDQSYAQFSDLQYIFVPNEYKGEIQNYLGDIAILVAKKTFKYSQTVQPVCINSGFDFTKIQYGSVSGWGFTRSSKPGPLTDVEVSPKSFSKCVRDLPEDYQVFLTRDKLCISYVESGTSMCSGTSGSGLVFDQQGRYHVAGVASTSPNYEGGCTNQQYGLYTNVSHYFESFILPKLAEFQT